MRIRVAFLGIAAGVAAVLVLLSENAGVRATRDAPAPKPRAADRVRPRAVLARKPFLGVSCRIPNSIACDRVGLAVWLRKPAERVRAEIDGRRFTLEAAEYSDPRPRMFTGFLRPAGLRDGELRVPIPAENDWWLGGGRVSARVRISVEAGGRTRVTELDVRLQAGFG